MEVIPSEFEFFKPSPVQTVILQDYEQMVSPTTAIQPDTTDALNTIEFDIKGSSDLYRDFNNSYIMLKLKLTKANGTNVEDDIAAAPTNLALHSLFSNIAITLCGKEITESGSLYPYRAYFETLLSHSNDVLNGRIAIEGFAKDDSGHMDSIALAGNTPVPNSGFKERQKLVAGSRHFVLLGRPHADIFHQPLDIPPGCSINIKMTPSVAAFSIMEAAGGSSKFVLLDAKLFLRTKKVSPDLILAHKQMLQHANMRFPMNRVTVARYPITKGLRSVDIPLNFPAKLPKRVFLGFVANSALTGARNENPFNFKHYNLDKLALKVNGVSVPAIELSMDYANGNYQRAYINTMAALGLDNSDRAIDISPHDFANGYAVYGFKIAPGPLDSTVLTATDSVGNIGVYASFDRELPVNVDMVVFAETPAVLEIDQLNHVTLV